MADRAAGAPGPDSRSTPAITADQAVWAGQVLRSAARESPPGSRWSEAAQAAGVLVDLVDQLEEAERSLRQANDALRDLVAVASHDLRSPVAVLTGLAETLVSGWDRMNDASRREAVEVVARAADRMGRLVENLLMVSRLDAGTAQGHVGPVRLAEAVRAAAGGLPDLDDVTVDVGAGVVVQVDPDHLQRMLTNYLHNAVAHGRPPVLVSARAEGALVVVRVADSGPGVPEEFVGRLFLRFSQAPGSGRGSGLGLSIVRDLARGAGGDAWYESQEQPCFAVSLPAEAGV